MRADEEELIQQFDALDDIGELEETEDQEPSLVHRTPDVSIRAPVIQNDPGSPTTPTGSAPGSFMIERSPREDDLMSFGIIAQGGIGYEHKVFGTLVPEIQQVELFFQASPDNQYGKVMSLSGYVSRCHIVNSVRIGIILRFAGNEWRVVKTYSQIKALHSKLKNAKRRHFLANITLFPLSTRTGKLPPLNCHGKLCGMGHARHENELDKFREDYTDYLSRILNTDWLRNTVHVSTFLQCSPFSFIPELGEKLFETQVTLKIIFELRRIRLLCRRGRQKTSRNRGWLVLKDSCILFMTSSRLRNVFLVDQHCSIKKLQKNKLELSNLSSRLEIGAFKQESQNKLFEEIQVLQKNSEYSTVNHENSSFAPVRHNSQCNFFVDGFKYFQAVYNAINAAKEEIFITDWWLSPEIFLVRKPDPNKGSTLDPFYRLDRLLQRKAKEKVKVYVLLFKEAMMMNMDSKHAAVVLELLDKKNIRVMRSPINRFHSKIYWAHHEKIVVVDQSVAFVGGIDLCFGRWDDAVHRLTDLGKMHSAVPMDHDASKTIRYKFRHLYMRVDRETVFNIRQKLQSSKYDQTKSRVRGTPSLKRWKRNSNQSKRTLWSKFEQRMGRKDVDGATDSQRLSRCVDDADDGGPDRERIDSNDFIANYSMAHVSREVNPEAYLWMGQDYVNVIMRDNIDVSDPWKNVIDRTEHPRMPWHDVSSLVIGQAARDVSRHFIQRWNNFKMEAKPGSDYPLIVPKSTKYTGIDPNFTEIFDQTIPASCQVLRSVSEWSALLRSDYTERSIYEAYITEIRKAQHYIYIENQFYITSTSYGSHQLENRIGAEIEAKIEEAHNNDRKFRVYLVIPLLPGFEGRLTGNDGADIPRKIQNWIYVTLRSMVQRLAKKGIPFMEYLTICGLRTHGELKDRLVTEIIFPHDKVMIVDDRVAIIGSANINDRSMLGDRDSEVALLFRDTHFIPSLMNGQPYKAGRFAYNLRQTLWKEHLMETADMQDPISDEFFRERWVKTAAKNTKIYEDVFNVIPTDSVQSFAHVKAHLAKPKQAEIDKESAVFQLTQVLGYVVLFPILYLNSEDLGDLPVGRSTQFVPEKLFC